MKKQKIIERIYRLTPMQEGMLFHALADKDSLAYTEQIAFDVKGDVNIELVHKSINAVVEKHDILRTGIVHKGVKEPRQVVLKERKLKVSYEDYSNMEDKQKHIEAFERSDRERGFDLTKDHLLRLSIIKKDTETYRFIWSFHHIIMDGWCMPIIFSECFENYHKLCKHMSLEHHQATPFIDYIKWLEDQDKEEGEAYWTTYLEAYEDKAVIPFIKERDPKGNYNHCTLEYVIEENITKKLSDFAKASKVTLNTVMQSIWGILLQRYNNTDDVVFGNIVSSRPAEIEGIEEMIGIFINAIPIRIKAEGDMTFKALTQKVQESAIASEKYAYIPLAQVQSTSHLKNELIDHLLVFENYPMDQMQEENREKGLLGVDFDSISVFEQTNYDFNITIIPDKTIKVVFSYNGLKYNAENIQAIASHMKSALESVVENPEIALTDINILSKEEKEKLVDTFNDTYAEYPRDKTIPELFEEQVERTPDNIAVVYGSEKLTYKELNERTNQLARMLREKGVKAESLVGIMVERSVEMIISIIGILKAGGAYLPIDPDYPNSRIQYMIKDSGVNILLTGRDIAKGIETDCHKIDVYDKSLYRGDASNLVKVNTSENLAYIIYTSGSTGKPKGVMIEHRGVINLSISQKKVFNIDESDNILQFSSICFDASVEQIFITLFSGASLVLIDKERILDIHKFEAYIDEQKVTHIHAVPAFLDKVTSHRSFNLKRVISGGDICSINLANEWYKTVDFYNEYGPTETTVTSIQLLVKDMDKGLSQLTIGKPIGNTKVYILNKEHKALPIGVPGELCISGEGVARGYLHRPELTKEKFVDNPFIPGDRMYKTGDLARWLPDGNIEFLGRIDHQVKIRGYRIELGEIEAQLIKHEKIKEAVVLAKKDESGNKYLCGYIVVEEALKVQVLREHLAKELPDYMIPTSYVELDKMPLTASGKIDRKVLPEPDGDMNTGVAYVAPENKTEERLVEIWQDVLGIEKAGIKDNFFELGGHSLKATSLVSKIHKVFNVEVPLREVFKKPTVKELAIFIKSTEESLYASIEPVEKKAYYELSSAQRRLYVLNQLEGAQTSYNMPGVMEIEGSLDKGKLEEAFKEVIRRHESLRTSFEVVDGEPVQMVHSEAEFTIDYEEVNETEIDERIKGFVKAFDLSKAPLLRMGLLKVQKNKHIMLFDMHHIISDGVSINVLIREFTQIYEGKKFPELKVHYKDYSTWQNKLLKSDDMKKQEEYWINQFRGEVPVLSMPTDYPRPSVQSFEGDRIAFEIGQKLTRKLETIAKETETTMYMVLLAAYNTLLYKCTGQEDMVVGSPIAGRPHADLEHIIGMFVNTLAMRNEPRGDKSFKELLRKVKENALKAYENQDYQFEELVEKLDLKRDMSRNPLFDTMFVLQNTGSMAIEIQDLSFKPYPMENNISHFDMTLSGEERDGKVYFDLEYSTRLFRKATIERFAEHYRNILKKIAENMDVKLSEIDMMSPQEREQVLYDFNDTKVDYPRDKTIQELFEEQVERTPDNIAVVYEDKQLTYMELNQRANQLARILRKKGVKPDCIVGIMVERSIEMMVGIMGILKAGGAYLPIDPGYPGERISYMLEDSGTSIVLTASEEKIQSEIDLTIINIKDVDIYGVEKSNLETINNPEDLAYIIYTSGSTGKPKGNETIHYNVNRVVKNTNYINILPEDTLLQLSNYAFDGSVFDIFGALLNGAKLILIHKEKVLNINELGHTIIEKGVSVFFITTALFNTLIDNNIECFKNIRKVLFGGERISVSHAKKALAFMGQDRIIHVYGPTESTVFSSYYFINEIDDNRDTIPIGKPISNTEIYILSKDYKINPVGTVGELCISGDGLARGYVNNKELTLKKFIKNPYKPEEKMYTTGDLAKWLPDGNVEFIGRIDHQVKIRGYRIELGEIEAQLLKHKAIKEALVVAKEDESSNKYLCGYIVTKRELKVQEIRKHLAKELPDYMVPSIYIMLEKMPLTANKKIDRKALPEPDGNSNTGAAYVAPRNKTEERLADIWQEVLGLEKVGIKDNFFEVGGDSIKAIQIASRLSKSGMKLEIKDMMSKPTIEDMSGSVKVHAKNEAYQGVVEGEVSLTPIQRWFFEKSLTGMNHWNQAVMLYRKEGFGEERLLQVFNHIVKHHDALRMRYNIENHEVIQYNRGAQEGKLYTLETMDFSNCVDYEKKIEEAASKIQGSMDIGSGPLVKLGLFKTIEGEHLLIAIHHLVVDGISWRILFEDFAAAYQQIIRGEELALPEKTASFKDWSKKLENYAGERKLLKEKAYWKALYEQEVEAIPVDNAVKIRKTKEVYTVSIQLSKEETEKLLKRANSGYNTEINDLLVASLGMAINEWCGNKKVMVNMEGHGRESIVDNTDLSRTVGWFTSCYPILLEGCSVGDIPQTVKTVKESMRRIPNKGVGHDILKYLSPRETILDMGFEKQAEISFNYLGQFGRDIDNEVFSMSDISVGETNHEDSEACYKLNINGLVMKDKLQMSFAYSRSEYKEETIKKLAELYKKSLIDVIEHCVSKDSTEHTPWDYGDTSLSLEELEGIRRNYGRPIEKIYRLTPMQEGMLFHALADKDSFAYTEQMAFDVKGHMEVKLLEKSINALIEKYDILRTGIVYKEVEEPRQVVLKERKLKVSYEDYSNMEEKEKSIEVFERTDRERGFNLTKDHLLRLSIIKKEAETYRLIWSFHHIIMDGWCMPIIFSECFENYHKLCKNMPLEHHQATPFIDYIKWLEDQDKEEGEAYWTKYLEAYEDKAVIPFRKERDAKGDYHHHTLEYVIEEDITKKLSDLAKESKVTLNTVMQSIWGILLQQYNNTDDVVFGNIVSSRPAGIEGIEEMIGIFINAIPVRIKAEGDMTFKALTKKVQESAIASEKYAYIPLAQVQSTSHLKSELIDHLVVFENYPMDQMQEENREKGLLEVDFESVSVFEQTNYDFSVTIMPGKAITIVFGYNGLTYDDRHIQAIASHMKSALESIVENPEMPLTDIVILSKEEKEKLINTFNDTKVDYPKDKTIPELFEEQVEITPDNIAVVYGSEKLTYNSLNERANHLARMLREKGVEAESLVGIMVEPSVEMIIGIMGILKAGGAYLPIDPDYPISRIQYMIKDSGVKLLLTGRDCAKGIETDCHIIDIYDKSLYKGDASNLVKVNHSESLAYIIYTSGSTGKPKGVMIEHKALSNLCHWHNTYYAVTESDRASKYAGFGFDASVWEIFPYLVKGASLYIIDKETRLDIYTLNDFFEENHISIGFLPTQMYEGFKEIDNKSLRILLTGGDKLKDYKEGPYQVYNNYGPTENTVVSTSYRMTEYVHNIPIGKPIDNTRIYILNKQEELQPIGIPGELCIGGEGLARGYLHRPALTKEKFVDSPWITGDRLYKTGDLARWLPDGNIEFLGRIDHQVKIRGYRIELGEIEAQLIQHNKIKEAVIVAKEDESSNKYLCGYIVVENEWKVQELKEHLTKELPGYMIPSTYVELEKMPLTANGKIDRKALPEPDDNSNTGAAYVAPRNKTEERLADIWQEVLGLEKVGIKDNFFEVGGDSIKAIQISSRLSKSGMKLEIKDMMSKPTIEDMSVSVKVLGKNEAYQGVVEGKVSLTPIQRWFFEKSFTGMNHWNQAVMLYRKEGFGEERLLQVFDKLVNHHDALRMHYHVEEHEVMQYNRGAEEGKLYTLETVDLRSHDYEKKSDYKKKIEEVASNIQGSMDIGSGPLVKLGLFKTIEGEHLLIAIHHLVVDGISWRILFEDFAAAYQQILKGQKVALPEKTASFKDWSKKLGNYAGERKLLKEKAYWKALYEQEVEAIPVDNEVKIRKVEEVHTVSIQLAKEETENLLKRANSGYNTEINDLLVASLGMAINEWCGNKKVMVNMEGHGRESIVDNTDLSRTVGWFTSCYPILLEGCSLGDIAGMVKTVKESMRRIPNKGVGHDILKYLSPRETILDMGFEKQAEISFNYLGQFGRDIDNEVFSMSDISAGETHHEDSEACYKLNINGLVMKDKLQMSFAYSRSEYKEETIKKLAELYKKSLIDVIEHCVSKDSTEHTPWDYGDTSLSLEELEGIRRNYGRSIEKIYRLTPMQEGMLFHALADKDSFAYTEQMAFDVKGHMEAKLLEKSINALIEKYDILRTGIVYKEVEEPRQVVLKERKLKVSYEDYSNMEEKEDRIEAFERTDRERGFDLTKDHLLRLSIIKKDVETYRLIWSFHHIIMDGWCMPIIFSECFENYHKLCKNMPLEHHQATPFIDYIKWLEGQDKEEGEAYWTTYLEAYEDKAVIPFRKERDAKGNYNHRTLEYIIEEDITKKLSDLAKASKVTLNTVMQSIWGILLQQYNNTDDVVFGNIVSSRPAEIEGIEEMIGIFINAIPIRIKAEGDMTFKALTQKVQESAIASEKYAYIPLAQVQSTSHLKSELIDHLMVFENYPMDQMQEENREKVLLEVDFDSVSVFEQTNYDFNITIIPGKTIKVELSYNGLTYDDRHIQAIASHMKSALESIVENHEIALTDINILSKEEKEKLVDTFNDTYAEYPRDKTIQELFEKQVERTPDNIAVVFEDKQLTYMELNQRANQLARILRKKGVKPDGIVGIMVERSIDMIVGIMGILKAGGAYLPIDPEYPMERISYMMKDSHAETLLSQSNYIHNIKFEGEIIDVRDESIYTEEVSNIKTVNNPGDLAYIIYTSGSTGKPKGVMIEHRSVINLTTSQKEAFKIDEQDNILQFSSICSDPSVEQTFMTLFSGASLVLIDKEKILDPHKFEAYIADHNVTHIDSVPVFLDKMITHKSSNLKRVVSGGDICSIDLAKKWYKTVDFYNAYGPTETTVTAIQLLIRDTDVHEGLSQLTIGKPIGNTKVYILNKEHKALPIGVPGELCISGEGVARGYLNRPELTKEKFVDNPFIPGERMYKTGDLARWLPNGNIEFLGRVDEQVKIRGYRIELGEIEAQLLKHKEIKEAAVVAKEDESSNKYLCGYIVPKGELKIQEIRKHLSKELLDYMIPSCYVELEEMPLTPNGKIDRKALPEPDGSIHTGAAYTEPTNEVEARLVKIWEEVLKVDKVGINDNFFELGGHSLKAGAIISRIYRHFKVDIPLMEIFKTPTIKAIGKLITHLERDAILKNDNNCILLNEKRKKHVFAFPPIIGSAIAFKHLAKHVDSHSLYSFDYIEDEDKIKQYADFIMSISDEESYVLMGYSAGGNVAFEVAKELEKRHKKVSDILMIDAYRRHQVDAKEEITAFKKEKLEQAFLNVIQGDEGHEEAAATMDFFVSKAMDQTQKYMAYFQTMTNEGTIHANIYMLKSNESIVEDPERYWEKVTTGVVQVVEGIGNHEHMLSDPSYVKQNGKLVREILDEISRL
ncbi:amino acid adenylation domain-containing protein [Vallitalea pronyensis]|uniref:Amino acid adenylation domain-containing protein n=1 Tax=Vallitalea pronyensis TaxID=1348613 RepID=A0A8J8SI16_9FIRM|nr:non-ribosomal peptide synthetase [Vallitalea pronyensis]QUI24146.1 amino acid adenylation domain-containing protein [Vallitalea pronyensis]